MLLKVNGISRWVKARVSFLVEYYLGLLGDLKCKSRFYSSFIRFRICHLQSCECIWFIFGMGLQRDDCAFLLIVIFIITRDD